MKPEVKKSGSLHKLAGRKILFVLCGFELGGAERQALHLARYLKNAGCDVVVWGHHHHKVGPERVIQQCEALGIPWAVHKFRWPCGKIAFLRDLWGLWRALRRERPDVILPYTTWPNVGCNFIAWWMPKSITIWGQRDIAQLRGGWIEKKAYCSASAVICNAEHEVGFLQQSLGGISAPVFVVHNGTETSDPLNTRAEWRAKLGINSDAVVAVMLANFRSDKDHVTLLHAWRNLLDGGAVDPKQVHLILAGATQEAYDAIYKLATSLELSDVISFTDHVNDVAGLLTASDIGILMTAAEGLPNAVLEYMACGLPVIATDIPGNREVLGDDSIRMLSKAGDVDELVELLRLMFEQPELREKLGRKNRQRAEENFSVDTMCNSSACIISDLLGDSKSGEMGCVDV